MIGQVARDTGWSVEYILKLNYVTLVMMQADVPRYVDKPRMTPEEIARHFGDMEKKRKGSGKTEPLKKRTGPAGLFHQLCSKVNGTYQTGNIHG
ncbi:MAG: hypothetical protein LUI85_18965 [Bacteroides sp.]|nr:hypothetical protein [Bacteroides sp.]